MPKRNPNQREGDHSSNPGKKRRIIPWNPEETDSSVSATTLKRGKLATFWKVFAALTCIFALWLGWRIWVVILSPEATTSGGLASGDAGAQGGGTQAGSYKFVSRQRVERLKTEAFQSLADVRNISDDHPALLQALVNIERTFEGGVSRISSSAYAEAMVQFDHVVTQVADFRSLVDLKHSTQKSYDEFLDLLEPLEMARALAPYEYERALAKGNGGRFSLDNGQFTEANRSFREAIEIMLGLQDRIDSLMAEQELLGKQALGRGDKDKAIEHFTNILEFKPDYKFALKGLKRAENIDQVHALLQSARSKESGGDLEGALADFKRAFQLDEFSARAQQGQTRMAAVIKQNRYDFLMGAALAAVEAGNWDDAVDHYETALKGYPDIEEISERLAAARESRWQALLLASLETGRKAERKYEWVKARKAYLEVLDMENNHEEGLAGLLRTGKIIRTLHRYEKLLEIANEKTLRGDFQSAIRDFNAAMAIKPSYLPLDKKTSAMQEILRIQGQSVDIRFISDGRTWVSIAGYRRPDKFTNFNAKILPGNYLIKGSRKGYRDVVYRLAVRNGKPIDPITVICSTRN